jgi:hypothetical protein
MRISSIFSGIVANVTVKFVWKDSLNMLMASPGDVHGELAVGITAFEGTPSSPTLTLAYECK